MRRVGWTLGRPRGAHEHVQIDNAFLRARYLSRRAQARRRRERLSLSGLARAAGLVSPGRARPGPPEVEAGEIGPQPGGFQVPRRGLPVIAAAEEPVVVAERQPLAVAA